MEVYGVAEGEVESATIVRSLAASPADEMTDDAGPFTAMKGSECVQHLFRVARGSRFDGGRRDRSPRAGEASLRERRATSGGAGPLLHRLFQRAFRVAKQVRTHTDITRGAVSVGSVAVDLAVKIFGDLKTRKVLVLGAGETSERTARALVSRGVTDLRVTNRSGERAGQLAALVGGCAIGFNGWENQCREIDILISSTAADEPLLTREKLAPILRDRWDRPLFIIDIAVPRDVAPDVNEMEGVFLYDIDSLQSIAEQSLALRRQQVAAGEEIIAEHVADFGGWLRGARSGARAEKVRVASARSPKRRCARLNREADRSRHAWERARAGADFARGRGARGRRSPNLEVAIEIITTRGDEKSGAEPRGHRSTRGTQRALHR